VAVVAEEPNELERLVAQRIREQLGAKGGLERLIEGLQEIQAQRGVLGLIQAQLKGVQAQFGGSGRLEASAEVVVSPEAAVAVLESKSPAVANDIKGLSPQQINVAINLYIALVTTLMFLLQLFQSWHQQPPTQTEIHAVFNQTTTVVHQTINMPPPTP
jgi:hypothetical protein